MGDRVRITEVGPRDGLQNEPGAIATADKVRLVELCAATGVDEVEVTSFVSPKWVPQLGDAAPLLYELFFSRFHELDVVGVPGFPTAEEVRGGIDRTSMLSVLVPNEHGMDELLAMFTRPQKAPFVFRDRLAIEKIAVFAAASETFNKKNVNATIAVSIERFRPVIEKAKSYRMLARGYISCAIACPFEGPIAPDRVADVAEMLVDAGVDEIDLGDTIGAGTPETVRALLDAVRKRLGAGWWSADRMTLHLHDTFGRAAECVKTALDMGVRSFDGSVAGLGGCPYASTPGKRAPGNISTETLVRTVHDAGYQTGVNLDRLAEAAAFARRVVDESRASAAAGDGARA